MGSHLKKADVVVLVSVLNFLGNDVACVPVVRDLGHEFHVLGSKQVLVLPILQVVDFDLPLYWVVWVLEG